MKINIYFENTLTQKLVGYQKLYKQIANKIINEECKEGIYEVSVTIVDDETIWKYNKQYRKIDRPTDVLSFALNEADYLDIEGIPNNLGDILISYETAKRQARSYGHSIKREMAFLFTHGMLHLLGYDHMKEEDEKVMFARQEQILNELGIGRK